jgi:hypothetical protein
LPWLRSHPVAVSSIARACRHPAPARPQGDRAREACTDEARAQPVALEGPASTRPASGGGWVIDAKIILDVSRGGVSFQLRCSHSEDTGLAVILSLS